MTEAGTRGSSMTAIGVITLIVITGPNPAMSMHRLSSIPRRPKSRESI